MLPQVDIYIGELSPFGAALNFTVGSSRSNACGQRTYRHSKPNGGPEFGVVEESNPDDDSKYVERGDVQVRVMSGLNGGKHSNTRVLKDFFSAKSTAAKVQPQEACSAFICESY